MYRVIKGFTDLQDDYYPYKTGDLFPRKGLEVSPERLKELASNNNRRKAPLIELVEENPIATAMNPSEEPVEPVIEDKPKKRGRKKNAD